MRRKAPTMMVRAIAVLAALTLAAACGSDDGDANDASDTAAPATEAPASEAPATEAPSSEAPASEAPATSGDAAATLDKNGDGEVVFGIATPGPRDDGAYYQALVDGVTTFSEENGFAEPIVVDNIPPEEAATQLENLARQNVDVMMVGAGEIADPLNRADPEVPGPALVLQLRRRVPGRDRSAHPVQRRRLGDQLHRRLRHRPADAGRRADQGGVHRQQQLRLREGGVPGLRDRPRRGRPDFEWTYVATG